MIEHQLWTFNSALFLVVTIIILIFAIIFGINKVFDVSKIKNNWAEERCNPMIMPIASFFGHNTKENFEFCMGKIFNIHSLPFLSSISQMFTYFTALLTDIFDSISSLRNIIASLGGGINVVFQEFTERISMFFFELRISAIHIKTLIGRMYAILFSVMYMALSGVTGVTTFTNTFLFSFLNVFCFPGNTLINIEEKGAIPIKDVKIGDIISQSNAKVTGTFRFFSKGQPMVRIGNVVVSTNHYIMYLGHAIKAIDYPDAVKISDWNSNEPLYCLNTSNNHILVNGLDFLDYDETSSGDTDTMKFIENQINSTTASTTNPRKYEFTEYSPAIHENTIIKTHTGDKKAKDIVIGDKLVTGGEVVGLIRKEVSEICELSDGTITTPSTLYWNLNLNSWERFGLQFGFKSCKTELVSFIVVPNSQIELGNGMRIRDYMELCSPDSEVYYSKHLTTPFSNVFYTK